MVASQPASAKTSERIQSVSRRLGRLQFHLSGKFRVLQVADIQEGPTVCGDTIRLLGAACDRARPDVVIFTGNQIKGYDRAFAPTFRPRRWRSRGARPTPSRPALERTRRLVRAQAAQFLAPLIKRGVPYAITFGNHDFQCGLSAKELDAIYRGFPGCLNPDSSRQGTPPAGIPVPSSGMPRQRAFPCEPGTFALPVWDVPDENPLEHGVRVRRGVYERERERLDGTRAGEDAAIRSSRVDRPVLGLVCLFSGDYRRGGGYGAPDRRALRWLAALPATLGVRSLVFQHFAPPQAYRLLKAVPLTHAGAIQGYGAHSARAFILDPSKVAPGSLLGEGVSTPAKDAGEWRVLTRRALPTPAGPSSGFIGVLFGHDHRNAFAGSLDGLLLAATPTSGFGSYGPPAGRRGVRLVEFDARHPWHPRTRLLTFKSLVGGRSARSVYTFDPAPALAARRAGPVRTRRSGAPLAALLALLAGVGGALRRFFSTRGRRL